VTAVNPGAAGNLPPTFAPAGDLSKTVGPVLTVPRAQRGMRIYSEACGWALARAHSRSGDRIAIAAYLGGSDVFDKAITAFAAAYADQNERGHKSLVNAVASGRLTAERDT
jgi:hypothetical protein